MAMHLRFKSLYMSLPCSTHQQCEVTTDANFWGIIFTLSLLKFSNKCLRFATAGVEWQGILRVDAPRSGSRSELGTREAPWVLGRLLWRPLPQVRKMRSECSRQEAITFVNLLQRFYFCNKILCVLQ